MLKLIEDIVGNKYKVISDWLSTYPKLYDWLYFNATQMIGDNTSLNSVSGERKIDEFIDGSYTAELYFSISMVKGYDSETSLTNKFCFTNINLYHQTFRQLQDFDG